jgi:hypothetical protein
MVAHLGMTLAANARGPASLAVVPVDDPQVAAASLVALAISFAEQMSLKVMVADLYRGSPAARLLGVSEPGVHSVNLDGAEMAVAVTHSDDITPIGPISFPAAPPQAAPCDEKLATAFRSADLLLTLAGLDPAVGGEHLATWATTAVAVVTAGRSSATRIQAVGEMIRLARMRLDSAVLVGAERTDETLGVIHAPGHQYQPDRG